MKKGYIYFITAGPFVKIGWSADCGMSRLDHMQVGCPYRMVQEFTIDGDIRDEHAIHWHFLECKERGEWFRLEGRLKAFIDAYLATPLGEEQDAAFLEEVNKIWGRIPTRKAARAYEKAVYLAAKKSQTWGSFTWVTA